MLSIIRRHRLDISSRGSMFSVKTLRSDGAELSKRAQFRQTQPSTKILAYLDRLGIGFPSKSQRRKVKGRDDYRKMEKLLPPFPFDKGQKRAEKLFSASDFRSIPLNFNAGKDSVPEVAIVGRSNVGKSTLMNSLLGFKSNNMEAAVSPKPGETKQLQFYSVGRVSLPKSFSSFDAEINGRDKYHGNGELMDRRKKHRYNPALVVVDMPGYGFAFMNEEEKQRCHDLTVRYLCCRGSVLKRVVLLLDARHGLKVGDKSFLVDLMNQAFPDPYRPPSDLALDPSYVYPFTSEEVKVSWKLQIVLTKCDLVERMELARRLYTIQEQVDDIVVPYSRKYGALPVMVVSSASALGLIDLQRELASIVPSTKPQSFYDERKNKSKDASVHGTDVLGGILVADKNAPSDSKRPSSKLDAAARLHGNRVDKDGKLETLDVSDTELNRMLREEMVGTNTANSDRKVSSGSGRHVHTDMSTSRSSSRKRVHHHHPEAVVSGGSAFASPSSRSNNRSTPDNGTRPDKAKVMKKPRWIPREKGVQQDMYDEFDSDVDFKELRKSRNSNISAETREMVSKVTGATAKDVSSGAGDGGDYHRTASGVRDRQIRYEEGKIFRKTGTMSVPFDKNKKAEVSATRVKKDGETSRDRKKAYIKAKRGKGYAGDTGPTKGRQKPKVSTTRRSYPRSNSKRRSYP